MYIICPKLVLDKFFWYINWARIGTTKVFGYWSWGGFKIGVATCFLVFLFANQWNTCYMFLEPDKIFHTQSMVAIKERPHKLGKRSYPYVKKSFKTKEWQNSNRLSNFGYNWTLFHSKKNTINQNANMQLWGDARGHQKPETLFYGHSDYSVISDSLLYFARPMCTSTCSFIREYSCNRSYIWETDLILL